MTNSEVNFRMLRHTMTCDGGCTAEIAIELQTDDKADIPIFLDDEVRGMITRLALMMMWSVGEKHYCPRCGLSDGSTELLAIVTP